MENLTGKLLRLFGIGLLSCMLFVGYLLIGESGLTADGQTTVNDEGSSVQVKEDGTKIIKSADGTLVQVNPDGSKLIRNSDGTEVQKNANGSKLIKNADGTSIQINVDGSKVIKSADGTTVNVPDK